MQKPLSERLQEAGLSQSYIAGKAGVRQSTVWKVIHGQASSQTVMAVIEKLLKEAEGKKG